MPHFLQYSARIECYLSELYYNIMSKKHFTMLISNRDLYKINTIINYIYNYIYYY